MHVSIDLIASTGLFTLQQAAWSSVTTLNETTKTVSLYEKGCDFADSRGHFTSNCTEACQQPAAVWDSMFTLHNCLSYTTMSTLLSNGNLSSRDRDTALGMGYLPSFNLTAVTYPIDKCMHGFCREITDSGDCYSHNVHVSACFPFPFARLRRSG